MAEATVSDFYEALKAMDKGYSAVSTNGHNLFGDAQSIAWVRYLMGCEGRMKDLERVVVDLRTLQVKQQPLGKEFEKVLYDNLWDLYVRS